MPYCKQDQNDIKLFEDHPYIIAKTFVNNTMVSESWKNITFICPSCAL